LLRLCLLECHHLLLLSSGGLARLTTLSAVIHDVRIIVCRERIRLARILGNM
jgi:hypothetical protein